MRPRTRNLVIVATSMLSGLGLLWAFLAMPGDHEYGVYRSVGLGDRQLDQECILRALSDVPGVTSTRHYVTPAATSWSLPKLEKRVVPAYDNFVYESGDASGRVMVRPEFEALPPRLYVRATAEQGNNHSGGFTPSHVERIRKMMDSVYASLGASCGPLPPPEEVEERCNGVTCPERASHVEIPQ